MKPNHKKKARAMKRLKQPPVPNRDEIIASALEQAPIDPETWDLILIGDGSGQAWGSACGFACLSVERESDEVRPWCGAFNTGTVNLAEGMAYWLPLAYYAAQPRKEHRLFTRTHILTDSQLTANIGGDKERQQVTKLNQGLWRAMQGFVTNGFAIQWHWVRRNTSAASVVADYLSKQARQAGLSMGIRDATERGG